MSSSDLGALSVEVVDGLLPVPFVIMDARVHDQPHGAPHLVGQFAELGVRVLVFTHFLAEELRVERPALDVCRVGVAVAAKVGEITEFLGAGDLQMVSRHGFVPARARSSPTWAGSRACRRLTQKTSPAGPGRRRTRPGRMPCTCPARWPPGWVPRRRAGGGRVLKSRGKERVGRLCLDLVGAQEGLRRLV